MEKQILYDWLIVVFLHEVQNDRKYSDDMIAAIEQAGCGENIAVFLILDAVSPDAATGGSVFKLSLSRLQKAETGGWCFEPVVSPDLRIRNSDKNGWKTAFKWIYSHYTGERNMLITFSEGAAFGINAEPTRIERPDVPAPRAFAYAPAPKGYVAIPVHAGGGGVMTNQYHIMDEAGMQHLEKMPGFSVNGAIKQEGNVFRIDKKTNLQVCKNLEVLWISELAGALEEALYGANIDVFLMANCYMQLFDNGYILSNKVKFLVAAEGRMSMRGYNFAALMKRLITTPAIPSEDLVEAVLTDLKKLYDDLHDTEAYFKATIFANRLKFYPLALRVFEDLLADLGALLPRIAPQLAAIRKQMLVVTNSDSYPLVDVGLWIQLVTTQIKELANAKQYQALFAELQKKINVGSLVSPISRSVDMGPGPKYGYSGISLYYPLDNALHQGQEVGWCANFGNAIPERFRTDSKWNRFLDKYFAALAKPPRPIIPKHVEVADK